jgi:hypothetical protein
MRSSADDATAANAIREKKRVWNSNSQTSHKENFFRTSTVMLPSGASWRDDVNCCTIDTTASDRFRFDDEIFAENGALAKVLSPVLRILNICGSYFENHKTTNEVQHTGGRQSSTCGTKYSTALTLFLWINAIRLLTAFTADDKFDELLINKLVMVSNYFQSAIVATACLFASRSGQLDQFLRHFRITTDFVTVVHRFTMARVVFFLVFSSVYVGLFIYAIYFTGGSFDFLMAPFITGVLMPFNGVWLYVAKSVCVVVNFLVLVIWVWPRVFNQILNEMLYRQFQIINDRFRMTITRRGLFNGSIKVFRNRHLLLGQAVRTIDQFTMIMNAASFCGNTFIIIVLLYAFVFLNYSNTIVIGIYVILLASSMLSVVLTLVNGMLVNTSVSKATHSKIFF